MNEEVLHHNFSHGSLITRSNCDGLKGKATDHAGRMSGVPAGKRKEGGRVQF